MVAVVVGGLLAALVLGVVGWTVVGGRLPAEPQGLAPIPTAFADVDDPSAPGVRALVGTAQSPIDNPDYADGPGRVATYRYKGVFDAPTPDGEVEVTVFSGRELARIHQDVGEQVDSPVDGVECWSYPDPKAYSCFVEYGNGWLLTADAPPGLALGSSSADLSVLAAVVNSVKAGNPFEEAVATHAGM